VNHTNIAREQTPFALHLVVLPVVFLVDRVAFFLLVAFFLADTVKLFSVLPWLI
jgi:hypothetical protein